MDRFALRVGGQDLAFEPAIPFRVVTQEAFREVDFAVGLFERFTNFLRDEARQHLAIVLDEIGRAADERAALRSRCVRPVILSCLGRGQRFVHLGGGSAGHLDEHLLVARIEDVERWAGRGAPRAGDVKGSIGFWYGHGYLRKMAREYGMGARRPDISVQLIQA